MLKFKTQSLGRIAEASVELAPLVILVGKNNTGKSYLATLIWALGELDRLDSFGRKIPRPKWLTDLLRGVDDSTSRSVQVDLQKGQELFRAISRKWGRHSKDLLAEAFAYDGFDKTKVEIEVSGFQPFELSITPGNLRKLEDQKERMLNLQVRFEDGQTHLLFGIPSSLFQGGTNAWLINIIFSQICGFVMYGSAWEKYRRQTYIPAARTGMMLGLAALVRNRLSPESKEDSPKLPRPVAVFLQKMASPGHSVRRTIQRSTPDWIRKRLICGEINGSSDPVPEFTYIPEGTKVSLPLYATSSMITELAPLQIALTSGMTGQHIIFEEPEAHLHLSAQRDMAILIARLISAGAYVTLTTHSDTFIQQLNNLMALHRHPNKSELMEKFGYESTDLLDRSVVRAYEFCQSENGTIVRPVKYGDDGLIVPSLNETLLALAKETVMLREGLDG